MEVLHIPINEIEQYEFNNRKHPPEQIERIAKSIKEFGFNQPILISQDKIIIAGHGRHLAALSLGLKTVPCVYPSKELSEQEIKALRILDNKLQNDSTWDYENVSLEIDWLEDNDFDVEAWGLDDLRLDVPEDEKEVEDDEFEETEQTEIYIKEGDLIELGSHRVLCGDSTDAAQVVELMNSKQAELCFTSPPYSDIREYDAAVGADLSVTNLIQFIDAFGAHSNYLVFNLGIKRQDHNIVEYWNDYLERAKKVYSKFLAWNVWAKPSAGSVGNQSSFIPICHEWVFVFGNMFKDINRTEERRSKPQKRNETSRRQADGTMKYSSKGEQLDLKEMESVYFCNTELSNTIRKCHPATFPVELPGVYIKAITSRRDVISDPFLGSGTTLIAADQLDRICYGMEISPKYCQVIIDRWQKHCEKAGKKPEIKINGEPFEWQDQKRS
jgi:DNA modification methylase